MWTRPLLSIVTMLAAGTLDDDYWQLLLVSLVGSKNTSQCSTVLYCTVLYCNVSCNYTPSWVIWEKNIGKQLRDGTMVLLCGAYDHTQTGGLTSISCITSSLHSLIMGQNVFMICFVFSIYLTLRLYHCWLDSSHFTFWYYLLSPQSSH